MKEIEESKYLYEGISDEVLKQRIERSLNWYIKKAVVYKRCYYVFTCASIVIPLASTILHSVSNEVFITAHLQIYSATLATLTTATTSLLALYRFKDHWKTYRETSEKIKSELVRFHLRAGKYSRGENKTLGMTLEKLIAQSNEEQMKLIDKTGRDELNGREAGEQEQQV